VAPRLQRRDERVDQRRPPRPRARSRQHRHTPFSFTAALHTYLKVREVEHLRIEGLRGLDYCDSADGDAIKKETGVGVSIDAEVDRIYHNAPPTLLVREDSRAMGIHSQNFPDVVVWNPWEDKCAALADMPADGFRRMLCVEAAAVREPVELAPAPAGGAGNRWWRCKPPGG
jgi:glucose-6-phosphate 1-epimerase